MVKVIISVTYLDCANSEFFHVLFHIFVFKVGTSKYERSVAESRKQGKPKKDRY